MDLYKDYLKKLNTDSTFKLIKDDKFYVDNIGSVQSKDKNDYNSNGLLTNSGSIYDSYKKRKDTISDIQKSLNQLNITDSDDKPLKPDSVFGPKTQSAWNKFAKTELPDKQNFLQNVAQTSQQKAADSIAYNPLLSFLTKNSDSLGSKKNYSTENYTPQKSKSLNTAYSQKPYFSPNISYTSAAKPLNTESYYKPLQNSNGITGKNLNYNTAPGALAASNSALPPSTGYISDNAEEKDNKAYKVTFYQPETLQEALEDAKQYGAPIELNKHNTIDTDVEAIARLLFHEDNTLEGMHAIAWTMLNRRNDPDYKSDDWRKILEEGYIKHISSEYEKFYDTNNWLKANPKWENENFKGYKRSTQLSWLMAIQIAKDLLSGNLKNNPFVNYFDDTSAVQYTSGFYAPTEGAVRIGNTYFNTIC